MTPAQAQAAVAETHSGVVFFLGDRAYKLKKPVDLGFLDFTTRGARLAACRREVELNRRLAPDVYLGVADVSGPDGEPCDHLVVMRRMPDDRRLSALVAAGEDLGVHLDRLVHVLAAFHLNAASAPEIDDAASRDGVAGRWEANAEEIRPFEGKVVDPAVTGRTMDLARRYLAGRERLFELRIADGRVRDGHGDLLADDIFCLDDGPRVLDCLEFDDRLRFGDVLGDVAFLAMDLERLGRPDLAANFLERYRLASGDSWPASLAHHYISYRAQVRAKVACLRWEQGDVQSADGARHLLGLCLDHLERSQVRLVLVGGPPRTGKSTVAAGLAEPLGALVIRSDQVRKELAGVDLDEDAAAALYEGIYAPAMTAATYTELLRRAENALGLGHSVILDATWQAPAWRARAQRLAERTSSELVELRCVTPLEVAVHRLEHQRPDDPSDATEEVVREAWAAYPEWPSATVIDTSRPPADAVSLALDRILPARPR